MRKYIRIYLYMYTYSFFQNELGVKWNPENKTKQKMNKLRCSARNDEEWKKRRKK